MQVNPETEVFVLLFTIYRMQRGKYEIMEEKEVIMPWPEWKTEQLLGRGAFGEVYQVVKGEFGAEIRAAVKIMRIPSDSSEIAQMEENGISVESYLSGIVSDITNEIMVMQTLKGAPNIVSIDDYEIVKAPQKLQWIIYIRMELLEDINKYRRKQLLTYEQVIQMGCELCNALEICRRKNIIHRDIKPSNIFISPFGEFKLGDFGISKHTENTQSAFLTRKGTYSYMAPEVYKGERYDYSIDLYSLGIVLYQMANNGRLPFYPPAGRNVMPEDAERALKKRIGGDSFPDPENGGKELGDVLRKACNIDSAKRYHSPARMREDLKKLLDSRKTVRPEKKETVIHYGTEEKPSKRITIEKEKAKKKEANYYSMILVIAALLTGIILIAMAVKKNGGTLLAQPTIKREIVAEQPETKKQKEPITTAQAETKQQKETIATEQPETKEQKETIATEQPETQQQKKTVAKKQSEEKKQKETTATEQSETEKMTNKIAEIPKASIIEKIIKQTETEEMTEKVTEKATEKITEKATEKATEKITEKATEKATEKITEKATEKQTETGSASYNGISAGTKCYVASQSKGADIYQDYADQTKTITHLTYGQDIEIEEIQNFFGKVTWKGKSGWIDLDRVNPYYLTANGFKMGASKYNGALLHKSTDLNSESLGVRVPTGTIFWCGENADEQQNGMLHVIYTGKDADSGKEVKAMDGYLLLYWMSPIYSEVDGYQVNAEKYNGALLHKSADPDSETLKIRIPTGTIFWLGENAKEAENDMLYVTYTGVNADSGKEVQKAEGYVDLRWMTPVNKEDK